MLYFKFYIDYTIYFLFFLRYSEVNKIAGAYFCRNAVLRAKIQISTDVPEKR